MIQVIQGERQEFTIDLTSEKTGNKFDLTGFSEIKVCFKAGTTIIEKLESVPADNVSVVSAINGQISAELSVADTDAMTAANDGAIEIEIDFGGGDIKKVQILSAFNVVNKICP